MWTKEVFAQGYERVSGDRSTCDPYLRLLTPEDYPRLDRLGFVLIAPESFALGVAPAVIASLADAGARILDMSFKQDLTEDEVSAMFVPGWVPHRFRFWLFQRRFLMGPNLALLVGNPKVPDMGAWLKEIKGFRIPLHATQGTIRSRLPAINGVLNLFHTADDPVYVVRNGIPFFSADRLVAALRASGGDGWNTQDVGDSLARCVALAPARSSCRSFWRVYVDVLVRLIVCAAHQASGRNFDVHRRALLGLSDIDPNRPSAPCEKIAEVLAAALRDGISSRAPIPNLLRSLIELDRAPHQDWIRLLESLDQTIPLSEWERLILLSTLYYADQELPGGLLTAIRSKICT